MAEFSVELVSITQGAGKLAGKTAEEVIVHNARVSNPSNQMNFETADKLLKYCIQHGHWSIFEQAFLGLEITTSRAISAQILRHKLFPQEFSQRYAEVVDIIEYEPRRQDAKNRQNSLDDLSQDDRLWFEGAQYDIIYNAKLAYQEALSRGIAKESARFLLPMASKTTLELTGCVRNWIHYIQARTDPSTQKEHRDIAEACKVIFISQFPIVSKALGWL